MPSRPAPRPPGRRRTSAARSPAPRPDTGTCGAACSLPATPTSAGTCPRSRTTDQGLSRSYYMAALLALYLRNTRVSASEPVFLTGGPRLGPTTTYFWDHTEWSRLYALLEPAACARGCTGRSAAPTTARSGSIPGTAARSGMTTPPTTTRCSGWSSTTSASPATWRSWTSRPAPRRCSTTSSRMAVGWQARQTTATGGVLADFGADPWTLLECVPNYVNAVASFNAAYVGMTRSFAGLLRMLGQRRAPHRRPRPTRTPSPALSSRCRCPAGAGRSGTRPGSSPSATAWTSGWSRRICTPTSARTQRAEAVSFASEKLLASTWMRALAPDDPAAPFSNRPDHGAAGAFCAWPGVTAYGLAKLGRKDLAAAAAQRRARVRVGRAVGSGDGDSRRRARRAGAGSGRRRVEPGLDRRSRHRRGGRIRPVRLRADLPRPRRRPAA